MNICLRYIAVALIICLTAGLIGCTTCRTVDIENADSSQYSPFDPEKKYQVRFSGGQVFRVSGEDLELRGETIGVKFNGESNFRYYRKDQINEICQQQHSTGKTIGLVAGVVGGAALFVALMIRFVVMPGLKD